MCIFKNMARVLAAAGILASASAVAQSYPVKSIRMIVPTAEET